MDALHAAAPLARLLFALDEAKHDGDLWLTRCGGQARISLIEGEIVSVAGVEGEPLGDLLMAHGELDVARERSLGRTSAMRIGARLVAVGAASSAAVERALSRQLVRRLAQLLRGPVTSLRLAPRLRLEGPSVSWRVGAAAATWAVLLATADELPEALLTQLAGSGCAALTPVGERRVSRLLALQRAGMLTSLLGALGARAKLDGVLAALQARPNEPHAALLPLRASLRALGLLEASGGGHSKQAGYALLLRKRRELLRNESARTLLDLPGSAGPEQARRALRRLARTLHPDRYEASDARLRALFGETLSALSRAEHALRTTP